jgi:predicted naringenin-chalcone synthase
MYWKITDRGWRLGLSKDIPSLIFDNIEDFVSDLLGKNYDTDNFDWALHPGILYLIKQKEGNQYWCHLKKH